MMISKPTLTFLGAIFLSSFPGSVFAAESANSGEHGFMASNLPPENNTWNKLQHTPRENRAKVKPIFTGLGNLASCKKTCALISSCTHFEYIGLIEQLTSILNPGNDGHQEDDIASCSFFDGTKSTNFATENNSTIYMIRRDLPKAEYAWSVEGDLGQYGGSGVPIMATVKGTLDDCKRACGEDTRCTHFTRCGLTPYVCTNSSGAFNNDSAIGRCELYQNNKWLGSLPSAKTYTITRTPSK